LEGGEDGKFLFLISPLPGGGGLAKRKEHTRRKEKTHGLHKNAKSKVSSSARGNKKYAKS